MLNLLLYIRWLVLVSLLCLLGCSSVETQSVTVVTISPPECKSYLTSFSNNILIGYTPKLVYAPGEKLELKISSPNSGYTLVIYREGPTPQLKLLRSGLSAPLQPMPNLGYATNANWATTFSQAIPSDWTTGLYEVLLVEAGSSQRCYEMVFAVNASPKTQPHIAVVLPEYTWQAYNHWGNASFYRCETPCVEGKYASIITTQRPNPWLYFRHTTDYDHIGNANLRLLNWLDQKGYTYSLLSDSQLDNNPQALDGFNVVMLGAHTEYWTASMYDHLEQHLARGGSLINWGGNGIYWKIVSKNDLLEVRKDASRHTLNDELGGQWRQVGRPEASLLGSRYTSAGIGRDKNSAYAVQDASHWALSGTGLVAGQHFGDVCSGWETDKIDPQFSPKNIELIARGLNPPDPKYPSTEPTGADMTYYDHPGGGGVFSTGSISFLNCTNDSVVSQIMSNVVDHLLSR